ncbi:MAG: glycoside hydrolase family protein [Clostridia bacterium]|nr:glycoside hydrolase family protein [Clostridia bacterium]
MAANLGYKAGKASVAFAMEDYYIWDSSVILVDGTYHMFASRWPKSLGFGSNWLFNSEIVHATSPTPEGPYIFQNVVLPRRGRAYFDGMNTHNTCIKAWDGKFYLYYMGTSYSGEIPTHESQIDSHRALEVWNRKRIGVAVADDINGPFVRQDHPLLEPRDPSHWDCTVTTNPTVAILPSGKTYMIYKSRSGVGMPLKLGMAVADHPAGPFTRLSDDPILDFKDDSAHIEDPYLWYDASRKTFCMIAKDDVKNGAHGITGEWGSGFYAESQDGISFTIAPDPTVYTRHVTWDNGRKTLQGNLERPSVLFDESGCPTHLFCATGSAKTPYAFTGNTFVACLKLHKE